MSSYPPPTTAVVSAADEPGPGRTPWSIPQVLALAVELGFVGWMLCQHQSLVTALEAAGGSTALVLGIGTVPAVVRRLAGKAAG
ncbi:hypothetical protein Amsp01_002750 [Amycolatopsis sp. NBRC 101858]|nr:hypothetical protein Amsp01_002750 [Amycolatopsis sp. NBRC 101858]